MNKSTLPPGVTSASATEQIDVAAAAFLTDSDSTSASRFNQLGLVHQARLAALTRTASAVSQQHGKSSPEAASAQAAAASAQNTASRLEVLGQQAATPEPTVAASGWALHGRVYDSRLKPLSRHTVFLVDAQNNYVEAHGFAYTDPTGYFLLQSKSATPESKSSDSGGLFLEVADTKARPVYRGTDPLQPLAGRAVYQTITLGAGEPSLGDPPRSVRKSAVPPTQS